VKTEINNENKGKFFAQYWGQKVYRKPEVPGFESTVGGFISDERVSKTGFLELKSISDISDEDAVDSYKIKESKSWLKDEFDISRIGNKWDCMFVADFLRSRGYLIPWMGLSCEEIIEAGWAKYKE
jgi:hypothetical protein